MECRHLIVDNFFPPHTSAFKSAHEGGKTAVDLCVNPIRSQLFFEQLGAENVKSA